MASALMVDAVTTRDRDDAFMVQALPSGWEVAVHIAAVTPLVPAGSTVDRRAITRGFSRYMSSGTKPMLGADVEEAGTLTEHAEREAMTVHMTFDAAGNLIGHRLARTHLPAGTCTPLTHQQVSAELADTAAAHHAQLGAAHDLASTLVARRRAAGAFAIFDVTRGLVTTEDGRLVRLASGQTADAYLIVQELMVAANTTVALWAIERDLPILFRSHRRAAVAPDAVDLLSEVSAELNSTPIVTEAMVQALTQRVNQTLRPAVYEPVAHSHYGLRVPAYCHATSPLRRYPDLVTQRIIFAELDDSEQPYSLNEIADICASINNLVRERRAEKSDAADAGKRRAATEAIISGSFAKLSAREWLRVLRVATQSAPPTSVVNELLSRATAGHLDGGQIAALLASPVDRWQPVAAQVLEATRMSAPHHAASVLSAWQQADGGETVAPRVEEVRGGPAHEPTFAVRVRLDSATSTWVVSETKKQAEQNAVWELIEILAGIKATAPHEAPPPSLASLSPSSPGGAQDVPDNPALLTGRAWLKAVRTAVAAPPSASLADQIRARAQEGDLEGPAVAAMLTSSDDQWRALRLEAVNVLRITAPNLALPVFAAWQQSVGQSPRTPPTEVQRSGTKHEPVFVIRASHGPWLSRWHSGPSKKDAEQQAIWDLVELIGGGDSQGRPDDKPRQTAAVPEVEPWSPLFIAPGQIEGETIAAAPVAPPGKPTRSADSVAAVVAGAPPLRHLDVPAAVLRHSALTVMLGSTRDERVKKYSNAVKSPAAWVNNLARQCGSTASVDSETVDGGVRVVVAVETPAAVLSGQAVASNKKVARAAASLQMILEAFALGHPPSNR